VSERSGAPRRLRLVADRILKGCQNLPARRLATAAPVVTATLWDPCGIAALSRFEYALPVGVHSAYGPATAATVATVVSGPAGILKSGRRV